VVRSHALASALVLWAATAAAATAGSALAAETVRTGDGTAGRKVDVSDPSAAPPPVAPPLSDVAPHWSTSSSLSEGGYRSSLSRGRLDFGMKFDAPVRNVRPGDGVIEPVAAFVPPLPTLSLGLLSTAAGTTPAASLLERATGAAAGVQRESKVGLEWKPAPSRLFLNRGLGIRLDNDDRLSMRLRKGSLGIFMKANF
jgi:hypothetical protein